MRHFSALMVVTLMAGSLACSTGGPKVTLPAVEPQQVEVFMPGEFPSEDYEVLKRIEVRDLVSADENEMVMNARQQAADVGADALIIRSLRTTQSGGGLQETNASRDRKILEALAVYYPSRHPELQEQQQQG
ncbi:MAG: hypothetical protein GWN99_19975 [Gemmatimonadetes bacterium]|uniref:Lipoprotein n=1 Tax=Candidatus Kutchimonas denitrificans TaxID=3056748 RepID=A0AAE5CDS4_9BACT|nr:hypothetical protein [Gemmatimonadota bacterium]NIR76484.1 hypothetical protein [Candidatus Kutchimonas denitrificans]NIS03302.1 hypothetical protein [Gemmatimonadota bacterium]NIT69163.1 hypothetical protein [Gemmatimonadota bacterium]NIU54555.1 hypothetical protein [Gemmatimonadota bacterium]